MRIVKEADVRKSEILDAAETLFSQKGFDSTSISDILEKVGIARGTLYYHFKSKEEIMDALIDRCTLSILKAAKEIALNQEIPVYERIVRVILALRIVNQKNGKEMVEQLHKPQNALMHQKAQKAMIFGVTPILAGILEEGIKLGLFDTPYPSECMEMVMLYADIVFDDEMGLSNQEFAKRIEALIFHIERMLGAKAGSLTESVRRIFADIREGL